MIHQSLKQFIEHVYTILNLLERAFTCDDIKDKIWARDVIESILLIVKEDDSIIGNKYLSDALYKSVMTCSSNKSEFSDIRSSDINTNSWYVILSNPQYTYTGDSIHILKSLLSESSNEPVRWNGNVRSSYFEVVGMYIHHYYHPISKNMLEHITKVLNSYSDSKPISVDYKNSALSILSLQIDKEHSIRIYELNNEIDMEYRIRMALINANENMSAEQLHIFEIELEDELQDRKESFKKQLTREKDNRISVLSSQLDNVNSDNARLLSSLKNMTKIVLERLSSHSERK